MHIRAYLPAIAAVVAIALPLQAQGAGDLARKCKKLDPLVLGTDEAGFKVSQPKYELETGECYKLEIVSTGKQEYALRGPEFFRNIWLRKLEAGGMEIKATHLFELEFEDEAEAELYFTPIRPGSYKLAAAGLEAKGTVVTINVK